MSKFTVVIPVYKNDKELERNLNYYKENNLDEYCDRIVVLDGYDSDIDFTGHNVTVYKILKDIPWNQSGAKNVGGINAKRDKILFSDVDHVLTPELSKEIYSLDLAKGVIYRAERISTTGEELHSPPGIVLVDKHSFKTIGGFDEGFAGAYGYEDTDFIRRIQNRFGTIDSVMLSGLMIVNVVGHTRGLDRNTDRNYKYLSSKKIMDCVHNNMEYKLIYYSQMQ